MRKALTYLGTGEANGSRGRPRITLDKTNVAMTSTTGPASESH